MSRTKEQIIWKNEFFDFTCYSLEKFQETIKEASCKIQEEFKQESFIRFNISEIHENKTCLIEIGHIRTETEEEKAINDKLEEENEKRRYNRLKADFERLKAKFEKN